MFRTRLLLLLLCLSALGRAASAQDKPKTKVVLYKDRIAAQWDTVNCVKNVLKANPLLFFRGEIPIYYERALSSRLSAELAVGLTYRNYIGLNFTGDDVDDFSRGTELIAKPSFHGGFRYYMADHLEPEGGYVQVEFAYLNFTKNITTKDSTGQFTDVKLKDERIFNDVRLYIGYQKLSGTSNWLFDVYGGVALRSRSLTTVEETFNPTASHWDYAVKEDKDVVPAFFLGVKVGMGW